MHAGEPSNKWGGMKLKVIQRARCAGTRAFHDVEVDHGRRDIGVAEEALNGSDIRSGFKQVCSKAMA
jgi:hypothetical protein